MAEMRPATGVTEVENNPFDQAENIRSSAVVPEPVVFPELPDHLKPLLEGIAEDVTPEQRERLRRSIWNFQDVFS